MTNQTTTRRRFPKAALIAAVILVLLAGTAIASVGMPATLRGWFAQEWEESTGSAMDEGQLALLDRLIQPVGVSDTENGVTVTLDSVTAGNSTVWMLLKVSGKYPAQEDSRYCFDTIYMEWDPDPDVVDTPGGTGLEVPYNGVTEDGMLTILVRFTIDLAGESSLLDSPRQATLTVGNLSDDGRLLQEGEWTLTFSLEPQEAQPALVLDTLLVPAQDLQTRKTTEVTLRDVEISATEITYVQAVEDQAWQILPAALVLSDGTVVRQGSGSSRFRDAAYTQWSSVYYWQVPVDLSQVAAVRFGTAEFPLGQGESAAP